MGVCFSLAAHNCVSMIQQEVMRACWYYFRLGNEPNTEPIQLTLGVASEPRDFLSEQRVIYVLENATGWVQCTTQTVNPDAEGNVNMFIRLDEEPTFSLWDQCHATLRCVAT